MSGGGVSFQPGYIPLSAQPGAVTAITALSKSTGTLELAWTAPGLDGFGRDLPNASVMRRIKHAFDPSGVMSPGRLPL